MPHAKYSEISLKNKFAWALMLVFTLAVCLGFASALSVGHGHAQSAEDVGVFSHAEADRESPDSDATDLDSVEEGSAELFDLTKRLFLKKCLKDHGGGDAAQAHCEALLESIIERVSEVEPLGLVEVRNGHH